MFAAAGGHAGALELCLAAGGAADAVVVGSGVIGSAVALELARAGRDVLVLDKAGGPGHGSTCASSAVIRFLYSTYDTVATSWEAKFMWEQWADHLGLPGFEPLADPPVLSRFHRTGMLHLDVPAVPWTEGMRLLESAGVPCEHLGPDELAARFPHLDTGAYWPNKPVADDAFWDDAEARLGAIHTPDAGYMDDPRLAADISNPFVGDHHGLLGGQSALHGRVPWQIDPLFDAKHGRSLQAVNLVASFDLAPSDHICCLDFDALNAIHCWPAQRDRNSDSYLVTP